MFATQVNIPDWLIPGLILMLIGAIAAFGARMVFKSFRQWIKEWFEHLMAEIKPNGGNTNSLGDQVLQVKAVVTQVQNEQETVRADLNAFNGTLKDAVTRVEEGVKGLYPRLEAVEAEQTRAREKLGAE